MLLSVVGWRLETQVLFVGFVDADRVHSPSGPQPGKGGGGARNSVELCVFPKNK